MQVASACINDYDPLPNPDSYLDHIFDLDESSDTVPVASMLVDYHYFSS